MLEFRQSKYLNRSKGKMQTNYEAGALLMTVILALIFGGYMGHELTLMKLDREIQHTRQMYPACAAMLDDLEKSHAANL
jgi:hypothetical protein